MPHSELPEFDTEILPKPIRKIWHWIAAVAAFITAMGILWEGITFAGPMMVGIVHNKSDIEAIKATATSQHTECMSGIQSISNDVTRLQDEQKELAAILHEEKVKQEADHDLLLKIDGKLDTLLSMRPEGHGAERLR